MSNAYVVTFHFELRFRLRAYISGIRIFDIKISCDHDKFDLCIC
jgi:hypothetical protein